MTSQPERNLQKLWNTQKVVDPRKFQQENSRALHRPRAALIMGRSRSRSPSRSSTSSEDEFERAEREAREAERRQERKEEREQRRIAKAKQRLEAASREKADKLQWRFFIEAPDNVKEEEPFDIWMCAKKPTWSHADCVDTHTWSGELGLEPYLRTQFEVPDTLKKIGIKGALYLDEQVALNFKACEPSGLANAHGQIVQLGQRLLDAAVVKVEVAVVAVGLGVKLKPKSKPRTDNQDKTAQACPRPPTRAKRVLPALTSTRTIATRLRRR